MSDLEIFPLSPASRMAAGLEILRCGLASWAQSRLQAQGLDPLSALPDSSPVRKHGYQLDARTALVIIRDNITALVESSEQTGLRKTIRTLLQKRDLWAHQQPLTHDDVTEWLRAGRHLTDALERFPASQSLAALTEAPADELIAASVILNTLLSDIPDNEPLPFITMESLAEELEGALYDASERTVFRALTWYTAQQWVLGEAPIIAMIVLPESDAAAIRDEAGLISPGFWWALGLAFDAPDEQRIETHQAALRALEQVRQDQCLDVQPQFD